MMGLVSLFLTVLIVCAIFLIAYFEPEKRIFRWLKGSRTRYWIDHYGDFRKTGVSVHSFEEEVKRITGPSIEISRGPFRRRSAIYGSAAKDWQIARVSLGNNAQGGFSADWVDLVDRSSLPVEHALHLINEYSSLQGLMIENRGQRNRIAELEKASVEPLAALRALDSKMLHNKQRFRSPAAKEIHANIRFALREIFVSEITSNPPGSATRWMERFEKPEASVLR